MNSPQDTGRITRFLILGCNHTGTTLVSGIFHINGYGSFNVSRLFENRDLNSLNKRLLADDPVSEEETESFVRRLETRTRGRWSLKDPRLSETVSKYYRHMKQPVKIVFHSRDPRPTVSHILSERRFYRKDLSEKQLLESAEEHWLRYNRSILNFLDNENSSPFIITDYDDILDGSSHHVLCRFVGHPLDLSFIQLSKRRAKPMDVSQELLDLHKDIQARYELNNRHIEATTEPVSVPRHRRRTVRTAFCIAQNRIINALRRRAELLASSVERSE
jgi:hypothetical protein